MTPDPASSQRLAQARTLLFVPGNRPERFERAAASGADAVVIDLEDAVAPADKPAARAAIAEAAPRLQALGVPVVLRLNAAGSADGGLDEAWLQRTAWRPAALMCPKAEGAQALARLHQALGLPLLPLIESAAGHAALDAVAAAPGVLRLVLGHLDFMADTGLQCSDDEVELAPLRFAIAMATRRAQLPPAVDGVTVQIGDAARLAADTRRALRFGFGGKLCIHPNQVAGVHQAMRPGDAELQQARRVLAAAAASGGGAVQLDGRMVDRPVILQAQRVLARARGD